MSVAKIRSKVRN